LTNREVRGERTVIRAADERDADLLVTWHDDPEVARYWDDERFTRDEMLERLRRGDVESFVVEAAGQPVGYLQVWREDDGGVIDMFLVPGRAAAGSARTRHGPSHATCATSAAGGGSPSIRTSGTSARSARGAAPGSGTSTSARPTTSTGPAGC
jgi:Acetyltransferase (GNAT) domain